MNHDWSATKQRGYWIYINYCGRGLTTDQIQHLPVDTDVDLWSKSTDWCRCNISESTPLWCPPLLPSPLSTMDGYQRCVDSGILASHPVCICQCICDYVPIAKNFKFAFAQKTFRRAFHLRTSPYECFCLMITSQSSDRASLTWLRQRHTVYCFIVEGKSLTRQTT